MKQLDPYTLRWMANAMLRSAKQKRYVAVQHAPMSYNRGYSSGGASALEHEVEFCREQARRIAREARVKKSKGAKT